eukprot:1147753-Pelagomonas_calceolata.AAC.1
MIRLYVVNASGNLQSKSLADRLLVKHPRPTFTGLQGFTLVTYSPNIWLISRCYKLQWGLTFSQ